MAFCYHAIDAGGQTVVDEVDAGSREQAVELLRNRGLFVTSLEPTRGDDHPGGRSGSAAAGRKGKFRDVFLFTQQMSMLLRSGARVVEALEAVRSQHCRRAWAGVLASIYGDVEEGRPLSVALSRFPRLFPGVFVSMVTAGEASGGLGLAFERLSTLTRQQKEIRLRIVGAMGYPLVLLVLCGAVLVVMFGFILPRFAEMLEAMNVDLPVTTSLLISASRWSRTHWPYVAGALAALVTGMVTFVRSQTGQRYLAYVGLRVPAFGVLGRNVILARICRIWGQLLQSKVGLLEAVELIHRGTTNHEFRELIARVAQAITDGKRIGPELKASWLISKTYAGAIATGEESGRLTDSLLFVASCLEDENAQALASLTRIIEPLILAVMGIVVGTMAISLFLPMFDMATMAGG